jgi:PAS domain S-box-containing protein
VRRSLRSYATGSSVRGQLLRILLLVALVPLIAMAIYVSVSMRAAVVRSAENNLSDRAALGAALVQQRVDQSSAALAALSTSPVLRDASADRLSLNEELAAAKSVYPEFDDITLIDENGDAVASTDFLFRGSWAPSTWFQAALAGQTAISQPRWLPSPGHLVVYFTAPVVADDGVVSVLAGQVDLDSIWLALDSVRIGSDGFAALIDSSGNYIAHPDRDRVLTPSGLQTQSMSGLLAIDEAGSSGGFVWHAESVVTLGWTSVALQPRAEIEAAVTGLLVRMIVLALVAVALATVSALWLSGVVSREAARLGQSLGRVTSGSLGERARPSRMSEFNELATQFNVMARALEGSTSELSESERRFRSLVVSGTDVIALVDQDYAIKYLSPSALRLLGMTEESARGRGLLETVHPGDRAALVESIAAAAQSPGSSHGAEFRVRSTDPGEWASMESVITSLLDDPAVAGVVVNARDVTHRKMLEHDIAVARELDQMKTEFVALASHELRTPLTGIYGFAQLLAASDLLPAEERGWADYIRIESERLTTITNELLNVSRIESGEFEFILDAVPLKELLHELVAPLEQAHPLHRFHIAIDGAVTAVADRQKLAEIATNLLDNAVKYSPNGGDVHVGASASGRLTEVTVTDTGLGIPAEEIPKLFTRFHRIYRPDHETIRSTGLGLYVVRKLVEGMAGEVCVESELGVGSTFRVTLPAGESLEDAA